jgi:hypothetical protein
MFFLKFLQAFLARWFLVFGSPGPLVPGLVPYEGYEPVPVPLELQLWSDQVEQLPPPLQDFFMKGLEDTELLSLISMRVFSKVKLRFLFESRPHLSGAHFWIKDRSFKFDFDLLWERGPVVELPEGYFRLHWGFISRVSLWEGDLRLETFLSLGPVKELEILPTPGIEVEEKLREKGISLQLLEQYRYLNALEVLRSAVKLNATAVPALVMAVSKCSRLKRLELRNTSLSLAELKSLGNLLQQARVGDQPPRLRTAILEQDTLLMGEGVFHL